MCTRFGIRPNVVAAYRPQANGLVERTNRTIATGIAKYVSDDPSRWDQHLPGVLLAIRTTFQSSAKFTPFYLTYGREAQLPIDLEYPSGPRGEESVEQRVANIVLRLDPSRDEALNNIRAAQERQKRGYDSHVKPKQYKIGQKVWKHKTNLQHSHSSKFESKWEGPFYIRESLGFGLYKIRDSAGRVQAKAIHGDRLQIYKEVESPPRILINDPIPTTNTERQKKTSSKRPPNKRNEQRNNGPQQRRSTNVA